MRTFAPAALAATTTAALLAVPATAAAPGQAVTVGAECAAGRGNVTLRQEQADDGTLHVLIEGSGVGNGRWKGVYNPAISGEGEDVHFTVRATDHALTIDLAVAQDLGAMSMAYLENGRSSCPIGHAETAGRVVTTTGPTSLYSEFPEPGSVEVAADIPCRKGSRWDVFVSATWGDELVGADVRLRCKKRMLHVRRTLSSAVDGAGRPDSVVVGGVSDGSEAEKIFWAVGSD